MNISVRASAAAAAAFILSGCALLDVRPDSPETEGERKSTFSYIPVDPLPVAVELGTNCPAFDTLTRGQVNELAHTDYLDALPDNTVRVSVAKINASGSISYGVGAIGAEDDRLRVVIDYGSSDVTNIEFAVYRKTPGDGAPVSLLDETAAREGFPIVLERVSADYDAPAAAEFYQVPVYVGVGLRLTAEVTVLKGTANISSLGALAAEAEAEKVAGTLVVQTLGISGKQVATSLPIPSSLDATTIQQAILSLGSIKAVMYNEELNLTPRVMGLYNPIPGGEDLITGIVSELAGSGVVWKRKCASNEP